MRQQRRDLRTDGGFLSLLQHCPLTLVTGATLLHSGGEARGGGELLTEVRPPGQKPSALTNCEKSYILT